MRALDFKLDAENKTNPVRKRTASSLSVRGKASLLKGIAISATSDQWSLHVRKSPSP